MPTTYSSGIKGYWMNPFEQLVTEVCVVAGFSEPQRLLSGEAIDYEGVSFALANHPASDPDALLVYADFGCLDLEKKAMLYPLMLKENFMMLESRNGTFAVSEIHDSVVLIEHLSLIKTTPQSLLTKMRAIAHKANYFNKQHRGLQHAAFRPVTPQAASLRSQLNFQRAAS